VIPLARQLAAFSTGLVLVGCGVAAAPSQATGPRALVHVAEGRADAIIDLMDDERAALVQASWRFAPVSFVEVQGVDLGADGRPSPSTEHVTIDLAPRLRAPSWESAAWQTIAPHEVGERRGHGHLAMGWLRVEVVLPERVGEVPIEGATIAFEVTADDYAEVWIDGRQRTWLGDRGGAVVAGWNAPNRVILTRSAHAGARHEVAILVMNGPISRSPENFYFVRQALLDVYAPREDAAPRATILPLVQHDARLGAVLSEPVIAEHLAAGLGDVTAMLWSPDGEALWLSDARADVVRRYVPSLDTLGVVRTHAGSSGEGLALERPGLGAMVRDAEGRVIASERGRGRVVRTERSLAETTLADRADLGDAIPDELVIDREARVWVVVERGETRSLVRIEPEGAVVIVESPTDLGDLAIAGDGRVLATCIDGSEIVSCAADAAGCTRASLEGDVAEDLLVDDAGRMLFATARGIAIHAADGTRLGVISTERAVHALAWGEPGALYAIVGDELVRLRWPSATLGP
jgi:sugar lactone lactonase YvrE